MQHYICGANKAFAYRPRPVESDPGSLIPSELSDSYEWCGVGTSSSVSSAMRSHHPRLADLVPGVVELVPSVVDLVPILVELVPSMVDLVRSMAPTDVPPLLSGPQQSS